jgi:NAD-specific glutamate dehydrogenase
MTAFAWTVVNWDAALLAKGLTWELSQLGRIEFALNGGHCNTDFIDNSGGVDCSDREVNIKILLNRLVAQGDLTFKQRNELLGDMTEDVSRLVLQSNYRQTPGDFHCEHGRCGAARGIPPPDDPL